MDLIPRALASVQRTQADVYYGNFSLFQSLPDAWAIDQLFPVAPLHRLNESPERVGVIADITCDCDGKIDRFVSASDPHPTLPLHAIKNGEPYYIGVFLIGAYQETLGDLHNLFGDPNVVSVRLDGEGHLEYSHEVQGDTIADVLSYVEFDPKQMRDKFREFVERTVRSGTITGAERRQVLAAYDDTMRSYTYIART
jgi:arginine decarboxylase